ncbi:hypothetical protein [Halostella salina]|uniref:hypothetical protein n=1 Tax=Halostella salina TaxID=1547897 RepID=UPI0013CE879D|nr:hypothetical protein [Halostella salina]
MLRRLPVHVLLFAAIVVTGFSVFLLFETGSAESLLVVLSLYGGLSIILAVRLLRVSKDHA